MTFDATDLVNSFRAAGAWIDDGAMDLVPVPGMGMGAVAKRRIEPHTPLFHIPLNYLLSPWTSDLRNLLSPAEWESLEGGWARLILVMMWEESRPESRWGGYLRNMPREFDSPMFWGDSDRAELKGTDIEDRIGREDAEAEYTGKMAPVIAARPDLFAAAAHHFTLDAFHVQGSRILSRSFTIPQTRAGGPPPEGVDEDGDDEEEAEVAVMVPMADMLNAAYERDNARLFTDGEDDEDDEAAAAVGEQKFGEGYTMITTKVIEAGEQIYNTYASPPNSELLRKYGHIASRLTAEEIGGWAFGNAGDEVEISGDIVVAAAAELLGQPSFVDVAAERVDWWLEEGQEDVFGLSFPDPDEEDDDDDDVPVAPPALIAFARLLSRDEDWARAEKRGKLPHTNPDPTSLGVIARAIRLRAARYPQTLEADLAVVADQSPAIRLNVRNAAVVRLGEKRLLASTLRAVEAEKTRLEDKEKARETADGKRKAAAKKDTSVKRRK
ncbi:uncharacterized protein EHS24_008872 [Apiotrichum porosum]|uniref:Rubisco LSMT substrate-binding domain-containing protein n=1 Tax=Apiotrichum porosum TaxID=105984 RepID=A0A427XMZ6_9TREE|nr:uncharacterized protein EHS24_008872 [Apiotrichum porosum]RSH80299.1 hypothetical protein EHS24_008872 [Apiotrichum porosum]